MDSRVDVYSFFLAVNKEMQSISRELGATPVPLGGDVSASLDPHSMGIDPRDGVSEDDLYGLLGCTHGSTDEEIKKNGK
eukprot:4020252-Karenia_brevis.AAC.1